MASHRSGWWAVLLVLLLCALGPPVQAAVPESFHSWSCAPDDTIVLDVERLWRLQRLPNDLPVVQEENEKLLSFFGLPFSFSVLRSDETDIDCLIRFASFMDAERGICPPYVSPVAKPTFVHTAAPHPQRLQLWQFYYYVFDAVALQQHFGEGRLRLLDRIRLPREWRLMERARAAGNQSVAYTREMVEAERRVRRLRVSSPPGRVLFNLGSHLMPMSWQVSFADIKIAFRAESSLSTRALPPVVRTALCASMTVDVSGVTKRQLTLEALISQQQYATHVDFFDSELQQVRDKHTYPALLSIINEEVAALQFKIYQQENWRAYQQQRAPTAPRHGDSTNLFSRPGREDLSAWESAKQTGVCDRVLRAWRTLQAQQRAAPSALDWSRDSRRQHLLSLSRRHHCTGLRAGDITPTQSTQTTVPEGAAALPAYCAVVCGGVQQMRAWSSSTTIPPTVAQIVALLMASFVYEQALSDGLIEPLPNRNASSSVADSALAAALDSALAATDMFDAQAFLVFATSTFHTRRCEGVLGSAAPDAHTCRVPQRLHAEIQYTQAMLTLLRTPSPHSTRRASSAPNDPTASVKALTQLQEAAWKGSLRATAAIATMREHGMWLRQHRKAAAALLMRSMARVPSFLHLELLQARLSPLVTPSRPLSPHHLLRYERVFAVPSSWPAVDNPFVTMETVKLMVAIEDVTGDDDSGEGPTAGNPYDESDSVHGPISTRISSMLLRALFHLTGFKDVRRSPEAAECKALAALRVLGYTCDMELRRAIGEPLKLSSMCEEHNTALTGLRFNAHYPRVRCAAVPARGTNVSRQQESDDEAFFTPRRSGGHEGGIRSMVVPKHEAHFEYLQSALVFLSYFYLTHRQQYDLSAVYAHLAFRAAANVHVATVNRMAAPERAQLARALLDMRTAPKSSASAAPQLRRKLSWSELQLVDRAAVSENVPDAVFDETRESVGGMAGLPDLAHSPFLRNDHWTLLGLVSVPAAQSVSSGSAASTEGQDPADGAAAQRLVQATLAFLVNGSHAAEAVASHRAQVLTSLSFFLQAATLWNVDAKSTNILDHTIYAVHRTDPFILAASVVSILSGAHRPGPATFAGQSVTAALREHVERTDIQSRVMRDSNYLPALNEADDAYSTRLLMAARTHVRRVESSNVMLTQGAAPRHLRAADAILNDAPPHAQQLNGLRLSKLYAMEDAEFRPLLYASDLHHYKDTSSRPWHRRLMDRLMDSIYYLFTETTEEAMARRMGFQVLDDAATVTPGNPPNTSSLSADAADVLSRDRSPALFVSLFQECFLAFPNVRELTIALTLFSFAMEQGLPHGFAVLFLEAMDRANPFLQAVTDYLATDVWTPATVRSMFTEHHAVAQWQNEKPALRSKRGTLLSLDRRSPFTYAKAEDRQELMARLARWHAQRELGVTSGATLNAAATTPSLASVRRASESLAMCASPLLHHLYVSHDYNMNTALRAARRYDLYEGMRLPVGAAECIMALQRLVSQQPQPCDTAPLAHLLKSLGDRRSAYYGLSDPTAMYADKLPRSDLELGERVNDVGTTQADTDDDLDNPPKPSKLVEPWNLIEDDHMRRTVDRGEGLFYNQRLHDVSGTQATARVLLWKEKLLRLLPFRW